MGLLNHTGGLPVPRSVRYWSGSMMFFIEPDVVELDDDDRRDGARQDVEVRLGARLTREAQGGRAQEKNPREVNPGHQ